MSDKITLKGMSFYGYHGVLPEERKLGQRFVVDVEIEADVRAAGRRDDITKTVRYDRVYQVVKSVVEGRPYKLIESVAEKTAEGVLKMPGVAAVLVRVKKPQPPIKGATMEWAGVEVYRTRGKK